MRAFRAGLFLAAMLAGCAGPGRTPAPDIEPPAPVRSAAAGIEVASLHLSAAGRIVDFRYRVLDAGKAASLLKRQVEPYALDIATGVRLIVPRAGKIGALRQSATQATEGKIYFILFGNTDRVVKRGSRITVVIGDLRLENLLVE